MLPAAEPMLMIAPLFASNIPGSTKLRQHNER